MRSCIKLLLYNVQCLQLYLPQQVEVGQTQCTSKAQVTTDKLSPGPTLLVRQTSPNLVVL